MRRISITWDDIGALAGRFRERLGAAGGQLVEAPLHAVVSGSGLQLSFLECRRVAHFDWSDLLPFPVSTVAGHALSASLWEKDGGGMRFLCMNGRLHYYQGFDLRQVTLPVRMLRALGVGNLVLTNAAGGLDPSWHPGTIMLIEDHLNLMGNNPLIGDNLDDAGPRFPDLSEPYSRRLRDLARRAAQVLGIRLETGVYAALTGPTYETPAEVRMLRTLGAHAVGMSTVPEVIVARHMGMEVLALSLITNLAAGMTEDLLTHDEVLATGAAASEKVSALILAVLEAQAASGQG